MKFNSAVLFVKDIEVSKAFYTELIGLEIAHDFGKNVIFDCSLSIWELSDQHTINQSLKTKANTNRMELYFEDDDIRTYYEKLRAADIIFLHGIKEEKWGQRTIRFYDPDNHLIELGESLTHFVSRLWKFGMTKKEIAKKTGIEINTITSLLDKL